MLPGAPGVSADYQDYSPPAAASTGASSKFSQPGVYTATIHEVNRRLRLHAEESGGALTYVDCESVFMAPGGAALVPSLMRDALHPTAKGMTAWFSVLAPAVARCAAAGPAPTTAALGQAPKTTLPAKL